MNARSPTGSNLAVYLYACSAAFRQISLQYYTYYTLLHLILINYCGTGCIRRLGNYSQSIHLVQNTHWILQHVKSCSMWFRQSISWIQRFRVTVTHWLSLTVNETDRLSLMPQLSYRVSCLWPGLDSTAITCDIYPRTNKNVRKMTVCQAWHRNLGSLWFFMSTTRTVTVPAGLTTGDIRGCCFNDWFATFWKDIVLFMDINTLVVLFFSVLQ